MSDFFDNLKNKLSQSVTVVSAKSKSTLEITKIYAQVESMKKQKKELIDELGMLVYDMYAHSTFDKEKIDHKYRTIADLDNEIAQKKNQIEKIKLEEQKIISSTPKIVCSCGNTLTVDMEFCNNCGTKKKDLLAGKTEGSVANELECAGCGAISPAGVRFCGKCGSQL